VPVLCPHCHSKAIRRSKRRGMFESSVLSLIPVRPFRCKLCDYRFYGVTSQPDSIQSKIAASR
jgi:ribosomal protein L37AE/L43A